MNHAITALLLQPEAQEAQEAQAPQSHYDRFQGVFESFKASYVNERHPTENTLRSLKMVVPRFLTFISKNRQDVNEIDKQDVIDYLNSLKGLRTSSRLLHLRIITLFMNWLHHMGTLKAQWETVTYKGRADVPRAPQKELTKEEVEKILNHMDNLKGKEKVLIQLLLARPLRIGELAKLEVRDVDLTGRTITITKGKNKKTRTISIPETIYDGLSQLIESAKLRHDLVFGLQTVSMIHIVNRVLEKAGVIRNGRSTHSLRHTVIMRMRHEAHVDVEVVAELAGNTPGTIYRNYNHVPVAAQRQAEQDLDRLLSV